MGSTREARDYTSWIVWRKPWRFNRTLKEQVVHGRDYRNLDELRDAVRQFAGRYNAQWLVEKNGFLSPDQAREQWNAAMSLRPAA